MLDLLIEKLTTKNKQTNNQGKTNNKNTNNSTK